LIAAGWNMSVIAQKQQRLHAGIVALAAAIFAVSVIAVSYQGSSTPKYALVSVGLLALILLSLLAYVRPLLTLAIALVFATSPIQLVVSLQWSALVSAFLLGGACLGFALRTPLRSMTSDPLILPVWIFAAYGIVSGAYGLLLGNEIGYVIGDFFQVMEFAAVYFLAVQLLNTDQKVRLLLRVLLISILITIVLELVLFTLGPGAGNLLPSWEGGALVSTSLVRTIDIDATILFAVLINIYPFAASRGQRFWIWMALIPTVANIALSLSRGLWLCTLIAAIASLLLQATKVRKRLLAATALLTICVVSLAGTWKIGSDSDGSLLSVLEDRVFHGVDQVEEGFAGTESMATRRFLEMAIVGPQVLAKPWMGYGLGATYVIGGFAVLDSGTTALIDNHFIHNLYLVTAFRMGVVGLGLLLWVLVRYFRLALRASRGMPPGIPKALLIGFVASVVGQLFLSLTQPTVIDHPTCALIACVMALGLRLAAIHTPGHKGQMELTHGS
jgi:hypothetical protein